MLFVNKVEAILKKQSGQDAIIAIDNLLTPLFYSNPDKLSLPEKNIVYVEELEREINNGGFNQFFFNGAGDYTEETIDALSAIGSKVFLEILTQARREFPPGRFPRDRSQRQAILKDMPEKSNDVWERLDQRFMRYEEDIHHLLVKYIKINITEFR
jgi:hypothetical protein